jgi:hypothetical protein
MCTESLTFIWMNSGRITLIKINIFFILQSPLPVLHLSNPPLPHPRHNFFFMHHFSGSYWTSSVSGGSIAGNHLLWELLIFVFWGMTACTRSMVEGYRRRRVQLTATRESTQCRKTEDLNQYTRSVWKVSVLIFLWTNLKCSTLLRHTSA